MSNKLFLTTAFCAAFVLGGASAAVAGEVTGNGKSLKPLNGKSACAFSGLEDLEEVGGPGVVQNFGNWENGPGGVKQGNNPSDEEGRAAPGVACNPSDPQNPD